MDEHGPVLNPEKAAEKVVGINDKRRKMLRLMFQLNAMGKLSLNNDALSSEINAASEPLSKVYACSGEVRSLLTLYIDMLSTDHRANWRGYGSLCRLITSTLDDMHHEGEVLRQLIDRGQFRTMAVREKADEALEAYETVHGIVAQLVTRLPAKELGKFTNNSDLRKVGVLYVEQ